MISVILVYLYSAFATIACSLPGWNSSLQDFIETGLTTAYIASSSYARAGGLTGEDVRAGESVLVTIILNNPKSIPLSYTLQVDSALVEGTVSAPAGTDSAINNLTTVSFSFIPAAAAEHGEIPFLLGISSPSLNRTFDSAVVTVRCDSPPDPVLNLTAGIRTGNYADIGFTLPEDYANDDIAAVRIIYTNDSTKESKTVTLPVSTTGSSLTDVPVPALLDSTAGLYIRYFIPTDVIQGNPYTFSVRTIDSSGKECESADPSAATNGDERFLGYDANGGIGAVAAKFGYNQTTTTLVAAGTSLSRAHYSFVRWNSAADGTGKDYNPGDSFVFPDSDTMLYAQWLRLGDVDVTIAEPIYGTLAFSTTSLTIAKNSLITISPSFSPDSSSSWVWFVDGIVQAGASASSFEWDTSEVSAGTHRITCALTADGIQYSGSIAVTVLPTLSVSFDGNGNTSGAAPSAQTFIAGAKVSIPAVSGSFAKSGSSFAGWATSSVRASAGTVDYANGALTSVLNDNLVLYAVWENAAPQPVTGFSATPGDGKVSLAWNDPGDGDLDYILITYTGRTSGSVAIHAGAQKCVVKNLAEGSVYVFTAVSYDTSGSASSESSVSAMTWLATVPIISSGPVVYVQKDYYNVPNNSFANTISAYRLGVCEVTYEQWHAVWTWAKNNGYAFSSTALGCETTGAAAGAEPTAAKLAPVSDITWGDAVIWCNALSQFQGLRPSYYADSGKTVVLKSAAAANDIASPYQASNVDWSSQGYRLPTEAEWLYAASAAGTTPWNYASGAASNTEAAAKLVAWGGANSGSTQHPVGVLAANAFGLYDMSGNVAEWLWDWSAAYPTTAQTDWRGPASGTAKMLMGGAWAGTYNVQLRIGERHIMGPSILGVGGGFRVCRSGGY